MTQITVEDAQRRLPDLLAAAAAGEEVVIIGTHERPAVRLVPLESERPRPRFGSARGQIILADDFDAPLDEFREYME